ncbi:hypothetical protein [Ramlibacter sp.]|uniref:hypothetical protein n=1 Tax=Ramlibacter sp. TaxID=1917967 RepID=UPI002D7E343A|nr:hypothetical protein [Ramlibacter sp.]
MLGLLEAEGRAGPPDSQSGTQACPETPASRQVLVDAPDTDSQDGHALSRFTMQDLIVFDRRVTRALPIIEAEFKCLDMQWQWMREANRALRFAAPVGVVVGLLLVEWRAGQCALSAACATALGVAGAEAKSLLNQRTPEVLQQRDARSLALDQLPLRRNWLHDRVLAIVFSHGSAGTVTTECARQLSHTLREASESPLRALVNPARHPLSETVRNGGDATRDVLDRMRDGVRAVLALPDDLIPKAEKLRWLSGSYVCGHGNGFLDEEGPIDEVTKKAIAVLISEVAGSPHLTLDDKRTFCFGGPDPESRRNTATATFAAVVRGIDSGSEPVRKHLLESIGAKSLNRIAGRLARSERARARRLRSIASKSQQAPRRPMTIHMPSMQPADD